MIQREQRQTRTSVGEEVKVVAEIPVFAGRVPADVAIRLRIIAVAIAMEVSGFPAITGMMGPKTSSSNNRGPITSNVKMSRIDDLPTNGFIEEAIAKDAKEGAISFFIC